MNRFFLFILIFGFFGCANMVEVRGRNNQNGDNFRSSLHFVVIKDGSSKNAFPSQEGVAITVCSYLADNNIEAVMGGTCDVTEAAFAKAGKHGAASVVSIEILNFDKATVLKPYVDVSIRIEFFDVSTRKLYFDEEIKNRCYGINYIGASIGDCVDKKISNTISKYNILYTRGYL